MPNKDTTYFGKDKRSNDGLKCYCNDCVKLKRKEAYLRAEWFMRHM
jgi:hypothetical protein